VDHVYSLYHWHMMTVNREALYISKCSVLYLESPNTNVSAQIRSAVKSDILVSGLILVSHFDI